MRQDHCISCSFRPVGASVLNQQIEGTSMTLPRHTSIKSNDTTESILSMGILKTFQRSNLDLDRARIDARRSCSARLRSSRSPAKPNHL